MNLHIVIVNYRTAELTLDCLRSLQQHVSGLGQAVRVTVTDNASPDGSGQKVKDAVSAAGWDSWCRVELLPSNGGFAYGNNAGVALADDKDCPYLLLLNPDTIVRPGAIEKLLAFAQSRPKVGIFGSRLEDPDGTAQCSAFRFPGIAAEFESAARFGLITKLLRRWQIAPPVSDAPHPCDWVAGACMLVRRELWDRLAGMDEDFFMYFEEVDFCLRARRAGWPCWYVPEARVVHLVGQASGVTDTKKPPKRRPAYWFESRKRYFRKYHSLAYALAADLAWISGNLLCRLHRSLRGKPHQDPPHLLRDFVGHLLPSPSKR